MPLPGLNPLEKAPPPGTQNSAASMAQAARLHQRITDLERRFDESETARRKDMTWFPVTYPSGYWTTYLSNTWPSPNNYVTFGVQKSGNWCNFVGLYKNAIAWNGGVPGTFQNMFQLPAGTRPGSIVMGLLYTVDTASQRMTVSCDVYPSGVVNMRYPEIVAGTSNGVQIFGTTLFNSWLAVG